MLIKSGFCHYVYLTDEWERKPMKDIKTLAVLTLTHAPFKMIDRYDNNERDVWGDDWDDCPASCNSGTPYGGKQVEINAGDLVIVIKRRKLTVEAKEKKVEP